MEIYRIYRWEDPNRGWGDAGTITFLLVNEMWEIKDKMEEFLGHKCCPMSYGFEKISLDELMGYYKRYFNQWNEIDFFLGIIKDIANRLDEDV